MTHLGFHSYCPYQSHPMTLQRCLYLVQWWSIFLKVSLVFVWSLYLHPYHLIHLGDQRQGTSLGLLLAEIKDMKKDKKFAIYDRAFCL